MPTMLGSRRQRGDRRVGVPDAGSTSTTRARERKWPPAYSLVVLVVLAMVGFNLWWYQVYRRGYPMHIDESGYTAFGFGLAQAFQHSGASGLVHAFESEQTVFGPLVPLLTAPVDLVAGQHILNGYVVVLVFYCLLVAGTYGLARRFLSPWFAALAATLVALAPAVLTYTRAYYFAIPSAAIITGALWCFLKSEALAKTTWVLAAGVLLGLAVLTRTALLVVVPCVFGAAALQIIVDRRDVPRRFVRLGSSALVAAAIAALWYVRNFGDAVGYLLGNRFTVPTPAPDRYRLSGVLRLLMQLIDLTYLPLAVVLAGAGAAAWLLARRGHRHTSASGVHVSSRALDLVFVGAAAGAIAFMYCVTEFSSGQYPFGEWLVVAPVVVTAAVAGVAALPARAHLIVSATVVVLALVNVVMLSGLAPALAQVRTVDAGPFGPITVTDGRQFLQQSWKTFRAGPAGRLPADFKAFRPLQRELTVWVIRYATKADERPVVFVAGGESIFLNINDFLLADRQLESNGLLVVGRVELAADAPLREYCDWLDNPKHGLANFVTTHRTRSVPGARAAPIPTEARLRVLGYHVVRTVDLPDGPTLIWWRPQSRAPSSCPSTARYVARRARTDSTVAGGRST